MSLWGVIHREAGNPGRSAAWVFPVNLIAARYPGADDGQPFASVNASDFPRVIVVLRHVEELLTYEFLRNPHPTVLFLVDLPPTTARDDRAHQNSHEGARPGE